MPLFDKISDMDSLIVIIKLYGSLLRNLLVPLLQFNYVNLPYSGPHLDRLIMNFSGMDYLKAIIKLIGSNRLVLVRRQLTINTN